MLFVVKADTFVDSHYAREFADLDSAMIFFDTVTCTRSAISRYKKVRLIDEKGRDFCIWHGTPESEAKTFYEACHEIWHDGAVSTALIADILCISLGKAKLLCEACLAWELPISKANGMWVF